MELHIPDMVWAIINFLVLVAILNKFLYKPLLGMLDKRKEEIVTNLENAKEAKNDALKMKEEYTRALEQSKQEAREILDKAVKIGEETKDSIIGQAREEATKITEKAQSMIRLEKEQAKAELRKEVASLAVLAAGKILDRTIQPEDHEKLISEFVHEVGDVS